MPEAPNNPAELSKLREGLGFATGMATSLFDLARGHAARAASVSTGLENFLNGPYAGWLTQAQALLSTAQQTAAQSLPSLRQAFHYLLLVSRAAAMLERQQKSLEDENIIIIPPLSASLPDWAEHCKDLSRVLAGLAPSLGDPGLHKLLVSLDQLISYYDDWQAGLKTPADFETLPNYDQALIDFVAQLFQESASRQASDLHISPGLGSVLLQCRQAGRLLPMLEAPLFIQKAIVSRIKILAFLDITERKVPQRDRISTQQVPGLESTVWSLRVGTLPTFYGEKIHIQFARRQAQPKNLDQLGFQQKDLARYQALLKARGGLVLHAGRENPGYKTSAWAALRYLASQGFNPHILEEPIHLHAPDLPATCVSNLLQDNHALNELLLHDVDAIASPKTSHSFEYFDLSLKAASAGKWIFAFLHTPSAVAALMRLLDMGLDPALICSGLSGVCAQVLLRRLCPHCRQAAPPTSQEAELLAGLGLKLEKIYQALGCPACRHSGYQGLQPTYELLVMDDALRNLLPHKPKPEDLQKAALASGMTPLAQAAAHIATGNTSLEKVLRAVI